MARGGLVVRRVRGGRSRLLGVCRGRRRGGVRLLDVLLSDDTGVGELIGIRWIRRACVCMRVGWGLTFTHETCFDVPCHGFAIPREDVIYKLKI